MLTLRSLQRAAPSATRRKSNLQGMPFEVRVFQTCSSLSFLSCHAILGQDMTGQNRTYLNTFSNFYSFCIIHGHPGVNAQQYCTIWCSFRLVQWSCVSLSFIQYQTRHCLKLDRAANCGSKNGCTSICAQRSLPQGRPPAAPNPCNSLVPYGIHADISMICTGLQIQDVMGVAPDIDH